MTWFSAQSKWISALTLPIFGNGIAAGWETSTSGLAQYRTLNMSKGDFVFAASGQVPKLMDKLDKEILSVRTPCTGMSEDQLTEAIAIVHVELILIHPFREGNGRLSRLAANVMALQAGRPQLDYTSWDERKADYFAAIRAGLSDYEPMKGLVRRALREAERHPDE